MRFICALALVVSVFAVDIHPFVGEDLASHEVAPVLIVLNKQHTASVESTGPVSDDAAQQLVDDLRAVAAGEEQEAVIALLKQHGAQNIRPFWITNAVAAVISRACFEELSSHGLVKRIDTDRAFRVVLPEPDVQQSANVTADAKAVEWNVAWVKANNLWGRGFMGNGFVHANADTGVEYMHPALVNAYRGNNGGGSFSHDYNWLDMTRSIHAPHHKPVKGAFACPANSPVPCDDNGHGTHTTGTTVGLAGTNEIGVAPQAKWIGCRNMLNGLGSPTTYVGCLQFALAPTDRAGNNPNAALRPHTVGNSYGCPNSEGCNPSTFNEIVPRLRAAGVFMAVSAGNSGAACNTVNDPPALNAGVCSVGASGLNTDTIASYSSRGTVRVDGSNRRKPDITAPGSSVRSAFPPNTYRSLSGTSMASPAVAGVVLLLWNAHPHLVRDVQATEDVIYRTAKPLYSTQGCGGDSSTARPNNVYGWGMIDALSAFHGAGKN